MDPSSVELIQNGVNRLGIERERVSHSPVSSQHGTAIPELRIGTFIGMAPGNLALVELGGLTAAPIIAESCVPLDALAAGRPVVVGFLGSNTAKAVILGFLARSHGAESPEAKSPATTTSSPASERVPVVEIDGQRLVFTADREIVLRCGTASVVLSKDGRITLEGVHIRSRAKGVNRIVGGTVQLN